MTGLAIAAAIDMAGAFASRGRAVVTGNAIARDPVVAKIGGAPGDRRMASLAIVIRRDVCRRFASGAGPVVTGEASA